MQIDPTHEAWSCRDHKCNKHLKFIKDTHRTIVRICKEASGETLPHTSKSKDVKIIPGWNEYVREHAERAVCGIVFG